MHRPELAIRDQVAWETWQEIANRQFRALLAADYKAQRALMLRRTPRWKRFFWAVACIEPRLPVDTL